MATTQEQYEGLVRRREGYARKHPGGYALRVGLLGAAIYNAGLRRAARVTAVNA